MPAVHPVRRLFLQPRDYGPVWLCLFSSKASEAGSLHLGRCRNRGCRDFPHVAAVKPGAARIPSGKTAGTVLVPPRIYKSRGWSVLHTCTKGGGSGWICCAEKPPVVFVNRRLIYTTTPQPPGRMSVSDCHQRAASPVPLLRHEEGCCAWPGMHPDL